jgi:predicted amidohydrolase
MENQLYVVACNACGLIGKLDFFGMSMIIDAKGDVLADAGEGEGEIYASLDMQVMNDWRAQIPCFNDRKPEIY